MIPFEYTMIGKNETIFEIAKEIEKDLAKLSAEGRDKSDYPKIIDDEIAKYPTNPVGYLKKVMILQRQAPAALRTLDEGVAAAGDSHLFHHARGMVYERAGQRDKAIDEFKTALDLYPIAIETSISLGTLLNRSERYQEAIEYWNRIIEMNPDDWVAWNGKAASEFYMGDYERAIKHATAMIFCASDMPHGYVNRGKIYLEMDKLDEAFSDFDEGLRLGAKKKEVTQAIKKQTQKLLKSERHAELLRVFEKAYDIDPDGLDTLIGLAGSYKLLGEKDKSREIARKTRDASLKTTNIEELEMAAQALFGIDMLREAADVTRRLYELTKNKGYLLNLGQIAMTLDDPTLVGPYMSQLRDMVSDRGEGEKYENVGRNDPCPCGSGQKFKKCHGA